MQVTKIEGLGKSRCKVYLEQEFAFVLYKGELRLYHVREGQELPEGDYRAIMVDVLPKRAKLRAMNLLTHREYTTAQLRAKLEQGFYPESVVDEAIAYVASFRYTDDVRYALDYIVCHEDSRSRRRIEQDLKRKGVSDDALRAAWQKWEDQGGAQDEGRMIRELLEKRHFDFRHAELGELRKQAAFLMRRGFSGESVRKALRGCMDDVDSI